MYHILDRSTLYFAAYLTLHLSSLCRRVYQQLLKTFYHLSGQCSDSLSVSIDALITATDFVYGHSLSVSLCYTVRHKQTVYKVANEAQILSE